MKTRDELITAMTAEMIKAAAQTPNEEAFAAEYATSTVDAALKGEACEMEIVNIWLPKTFSKRDFKAKGVFQLPAEAR